MNSSPLDTVGILSRAARDRTVGEIVADREERFRRCMTPEREWLSEQLIAGRWTPFDVVTTSGRFEQPTTLQQAMRQLHEWRRVITQHHRFQPTTVRARNMRTNTFILLAIS